MERPLVFFFLVYRPPEPADFFELLLALLDEAFDRPAPVRLLLLELDLPDVFLAPPGDAPDDFAFERPFPPALDDELREREPDLCDGDIVSAAAPTAPTAAPAAAPESMSPATSMTLLTNLDVVDLVDLEDLRADEVFLPLFDLLEFDLDLLELDLLAISPPVIRYYKL